MDGLSTLLQLAMSGACLGLLADGNKNHSEEALFGFRLNGRSPVDRTRRYPDHSIRNRGRLFARISTTFQRRIGWKPPDFLLRFCNIVLRIFVDTNRKGFAQ